MMNKILAMITAVNSNEFEEEVENIITIATDTQVLLSPINNRNELIFVCKLCVEVINGIIPTDVKEYCWLHLPS